MLLKGVVTVKRSPNWRNDDHLMSMPLTMEELRQLNPAKGDKVVGIDNGDGTFDIVCVDPQGGTMDDVLEWLTTRPKLAN